MGLRMSYKQVAARAAHFEAKQTVRAEGSEHDEQVALFRWAEVYSTQLPELRLMYAIPNGGKRHVAVAMKLKEEGQKSGVWDIHLPICRNDYIGLWIEMKYGKNTLTDNQKQWGAWMREEGHKTVVCYTWQVAARELVLYLGKDPAEFGAWL